MPCACAATAGANRTTVAAKRSAKVPMLLCISISSIDLWSAGYGCVSTINKSLTLEPAGPETRRRQGAQASAETVRQESVYARVSPYSGHALPQVLRLSFRGRSPRGYQKHSAALGRAIRSPNELPVAQRISCGPFL